jgi:hypothetical protein
LENGYGASNGNGIKNGKRDKGKENEVVRDIGASLAVPRTVMEEGIRITRECLEKIIVVE